MHVPLVYELAAEAIACTTVVGAPEGAAAAGISVAKVIAIVGTATVALVTYLTKCFNSLDKMQQRLHNNDAFPHGSWPRSTTTDLRDGSITDNNDSNWHMRNG